MKELVRKVEKLEDDVERLQSQQSATGGGGGTITSVSGTAPIASSGGTTPAISWNPTATFSDNGQQTQNFKLENLGAAPTGATGRGYVDTVLNAVRFYYNGSWHSLLDSVTSGVNSITWSAPFGNIGTATNPIPTLAVTTTNNGGAIALQSTTPGVSQTGNINVSGKVLGGTLDTNASGIILLSGTPMLQTGSSFPVGGLVNGQRYRHDTYKSWFVYDNPSTVWRQEAPGVFSGSFPTVSAGDNTVAPQITVKRLDRNNTNWYWDGTRWLSEQIFKMPLISRSNQPFAQAVTVFDLHLVDFAAYGGIYLSKIGSGIFFSAAQNATNFYTMSASIFDTSGASTAITLTGTTDTKTYTTAGSFRPMVPTVTPTAYGNTNMLLVVIMTPTLNPGTFFQNISAQFQLVG